MTGSRVHYGAIRSYGAGWRFGGGEDLMTIFYIEVRDLRFNLSLEFIRGAFKFVERLADLASNFGQLLGPEDDQGQQEDEDHLWKTEVHELHNTAGGDCHQCEAARSHNILGLGLESGASLFVMTHPNEGARPRQGDCPDGYFWIRKPDFAPRLTCYTSLRMRFLGICPARTEGNHDGS